MTEPDGGTERETREARRTRDPDPDELTGWCHKCGEAVGDKTILCDGCWEDGGRER